MMNLHTPRAAIMMIFAAFGAAVGCWAGAIPQVISAAGIDSFDLGLGFTLSSLAGVSAMAFGGMIGRRFSNRIVMLGVLPVLALNLILLLVATSFWLFFASLIAFGAILGFLDMAMNAEASAIEHDLRRPIFTTFHGGVSIAIAFFAVVSSFTSAMAGTFFTSMLGVAVLGVAWLMVYQSVPARAVTAGRAGGLSHLPSILPLVIIGLAVGLSIAAETSTLFWSAKLLNDQAPELAAIAGLGAAFYGVCNAIVRFHGDRLRARYGEVPLMLASLALAAAGFVVLGLSLSFAVNVVAFAGVGFGLAILCPCLFNMAASQVLANRSAGLSFAGLIAGPPRILAPWIFGWVATSQSTSFAFGLCAVLMVVAFGLIISLQSVNQRISTETAR
jgi:predicted MFS family arabinose efflux permease